MTNGSSDTIKRMIEIIFSFLHFILVLCSIIVVSVLLISFTTSVCVNNYSCRAIHAETFKRSECGGLFGNPCFSKRADINKTECCDAGNSDCWGGLNAKDSLYWIDCDTDSRNQQGFGQTIAACSACDITVYDNGMIVVTEEQGEQKTLGVFTCKY